MAAAAKGVPRRDVRGSVQSFPLTSVMVITRVDVIGIVFDLVDVDLDVDLVDVDLDVDIVDVDLNADVVDVDIDLADVAFKVGLDRDRNTRQECFRLLSFEKC